MQLCVVEIVPSVKRKDGLLTQLEEPLISLFSNTLDIVCRMLNSNHKMPGRKELFEPIMYFYFDSNLFLSLSHMARFMTTLEGRLCEFDFIHTDSTYLGPQSIDALQNHIQKLSLKKSTVFTICGLNDIVGDISNEMRLTLRHFINYNFYPGSPHMLLVLDQPVSMLDWLVELRIHSNINKVRLPIEKQDIYNYTASALKQHKPTPVELAKLGASLIHYTNLCDYEIKIAKLSRDLELCSSPKKRKRLIRDHPIIHSTCADQ